MKQFCVVAFGLLVAVGGSFSGVRVETRAQARPQRVNGDAAATQGNLASAPALYEEVAEYARRKFDEFAQRRMPFDQQLANKTFQEQRDLAVRHAATLAARGPLKGTDIFYLGRLYAVAERHEGAADAMRRFLVEASADASPENLQEARRVLVLSAVKLDLRDEAERALAEYVRAAAETLKPEDRYLLENVVAGAFYKVSQFERAAPHALEAFRAARLTQEKTDDARRRDDIIFNAGHLLANIYTKAGRRADAVATMNEVRQLGLAYPSADLYAKATGILERYGETITAAPPVAAATVQRAPDLIVAEWIDQQASKLADLRGRVVLLDFWATWCSPCLVTIPKLNGLQKKYRERGLVVLGLTDFQGMGEGRAMSPAEELAYLRRFKKRFNVDYGFAVADREDNSRNYGVSSLPTAVLIDRRGRVRHFIVGLYEGSDIELAAAVKQLLDEPVKE